MLSRLSFCPGNLLRARQSLSRPLGFGGYIRQQRDSILQVISMNAALTEAIEQLVQEAPGTWLEAVCAGLQSGPAGATAESMLERLPSTHNGDLAYRLREVVQ